MAHQKKASGEKLLLVEKCEDIRGLDSNLYQQKYEASTIKLAFPFSLASSIQDLEKVTIFPEIHHFNSSLTGIFKK